MNSQPIDPPVEKMQRAKAEALTQLVQAAILASPLGGSTAAMERTLFEFIKATENLADAKLEEACRDARSLDKAEAVDALLQGLRVSLKAEHDALGLLFDVEVVAAPADVEIGGEVACDCDEKDCPGVGVLGWA